MKEAIRHCQVRGCRRQARTSIESRKVVIIDTGALNGSTPVVGWKFQLCGEDERRVYEHLVNLIANGVPAGI